MNTTINLTNDDTGQHLVVAVNRATRHVSLGLEDGDSDAATIVSFKPTDARALAYAILEAADMVDATT